MTFDPQHSEQMDRLIEELKRIEKEQQRTDEISIAFLRDLDLKFRELVRVAHKILDRLEGVRSIASFNITQQGETPMSVAQGPLAGIVVGTSAVLTANPYDSNGNPSTAAAIAEVTLVWTSSDPVNFPVSSSGNAGDLNAQVSVAAGATVGATATISVAQTAPLSDGSNATGSATETALSAPPPPPPAQLIAQFILTQAPAT